MQIEELAAEVQAFADARDWAQFHDPKNLSMAISAEAGELTSVLRWTPNLEADAASRQEPIRDRLLTEVGDLAILLLLLCRRLDADLATVVKKKLEVNGRNYPIDRSKGRAERSDNSPK